MKSTTLAAVAVAVLLLTAGAATAIPDHAGSDASPNDEPDEANAGTDHDAASDNGDETNQSETESDDGDNADRNDAADEQEDESDAHADGTTIANDHNRSDGGADESEDNDGQDAEAGDGAQENESADQARESRGPPSDLPAQVPDHITTIHDLIRQFLGGGLAGDGLGSAVSDAAPSNGTGAVDG